ncbi:MAG: metallophosphoesterase [Candidatus Electryonea clarkiae]|nr:metallophosphoesterase [Candidatus Electryonea clarkiae]MDP8287050.1 metallophosphoesterase [Candidatus Electryonea clarkiae]
MKNLFNNVIASEAKQSPYSTVIHQLRGLLRFARNDGLSVAARNDGMFAVVLILIASCLFSSQSVSAEINRGKVGQIPNYPPDSLKIEDNDLFLLAEPKIELSEDLKATITFQTAVPCPAARVYFGIYEPDQLLRLPRYRPTVAESLDGYSTDHSITLDLTILMKPYFDITGIKENNGGLVAYRIEIFHPGWASSRFYNFRFRFKDADLVPTIIEGPFIDQVSETRVIISWDTNREVSGALLIGSNYFSTIEHKKLTHFEMEINDLLPGREYSYQIEIRDGEQVTTSPEYFFRTPESNLTRFSFAVMGDSREGVGGGESAYGGTNYKVITRFVMDAYNKGADFIIFTGDLVNGYTTSTTDFEMQLKAYKDAIESVGHLIPVYEVLGNHEIVRDVFSLENGKRVQFDKRGTESSEVFFANAFVNPANGPEPSLKGTPPYLENVYFFDYGRCRFVIMNNNYWWSKYPEEYGGNLEGYVLDDQYEWLKTTFNDAASDDNIDHVFLYAQEPMFPNTVHAKDGMWYHGGDPAKNKGIDRRYVVTRRDEIWREFVMTGKAIAGNFGDDHCYHRTLISSTLNTEFINPVWQLVSGGAGAPYYAQNKDVPWVDDVKKYSTQMNYTLFRVDGNKVMLEVYGFTGELIEEVELTKIP